MSGALQAVAECGGPGIDIAALASSIERNRFMPVPPINAVFVGDGDFLAIGAEFLRHVVGIGGLERDARVLDLGCGIGRLAVPLTQYLDKNASYHGIDPVRIGIDWCDTNISSVYPRFRFHHLDLRHAIYNPEGKIAGVDVRLPFPASSFDFVAMISVLTHLPAPEVRQYAKEVARVLAPKGRVFITAFVAGAGAGGKPRLTFMRSRKGPEWHTDAGSPLAAVAFDDGFIETAFEEAGLRLRHRQLGHWRGAPAPSYQDIFVFEKEATSA